MIRPTYEWHESDFDSIIQPDGSLDCLAPEYIDWRVGSESITLDGNFTITYLERILQHIKDARDKREKS